MKTKASGAKILLLDIETAPASAYTWSLWDVNIGLNQIITDKYVLMWSAKWLDNKEVMFDTVARHSHSSHYTNVGEKAIAKSIWKLLDEADIVITHYGNGFDLKELNGLFLKHHLKPVSSYVSIDTKAVVKQNFRFLSTKLEFILKKLELGEKAKHEGFGMWLGCMAGDKKAWDKMIKYCKRDVTELQKLYLELKPFIKNHPNLNLWNNTTGKCENGCKSRLEKKGFAYTKQNVYQRYICPECGKNTRDTKRIKRADNTGI